MSTAYMELYEKLTRLQWLLQRRQMKRRAMRGPGGDTSRGQGRVLAMLKLQPDISTKDLSYLLGIRQQSLNELLGKLEKAEYVTRTPSQSDRRVMLVRLTEKGEAAQIEKPEQGGIFDCLSEEEQASFGEYLSRIIAALEEELGTDAEEDERSAWMGDFRERMGEERFEQIFAMHRGMRGPGPHGPHGPGPRGGWGRHPGQDCGRFGGPEGRHGHGPQGPGCRGGHHGYGAHTPAPDGPDDEIIDFEDEES